MLRSGPVRGLGAAIVVVALSACGSGFTKLGPQETGAVTLRLLVGSGTTAEARVLREQTEDWAKRTGNTVSIVPSAELEQQLGQAFAGGTPPDLFYLSPSAFTRYAQSGSLYPYGEQIRVQKSLYPNLKKTFTEGGELYCAPKDFSTLSLIIDTDAWREAGLTDADVPRTWHQLHQVAKRLTKPNRPGLVMDDIGDRVGVFMRQSGGWFVDDAGQPTIDSPQNLRALRFVQGMLRSGSMKFSSGVGAGWGGEALGKGLGAMTIEGNWASGALEADFPKRRWKAVELPAGPAGPGTLSFTNCWGVPERTTKRAAAVSLVNHLMGTAQQRQVGKEVGVNPSNRAAVSSVVAGKPQMRGFVAGAPYATGEVTVNGFGSIEGEFDSRIFALSQGSDPKKLLAEVQRSAEQTLGKSER